MAELGQNDDELLGAPEQELLAVALRTRATTVDELAAVALIDPAGARALLARLEAAGYLAVADSRISYHSPDAVVAEQVLRGLGRLATTVQRDAAALSGLLGAMPKLVNDWAIGEADSVDLRTRIFHGPFAVTDLFLELQATQQVTTSWGCLPSASRMFEAEELRREGFHDAVAAHHGELRTIVATGDLSHPQARAVLERDIELGAEIRMLHHPPSWFFIADHEVVGLPLAWGEKWPTTTVLIRSEPVVALAAWVYEQLWEQAVPVFPAAAEWRDLVALLAQGATLESASSALGISARTGRRRLAEAMDRYGVQGAVALGAAWARDRADPRNGPDR